MKEEMTQDAVQENGTLVEGRNAVLEAFRSGKTIDKLYVLDGCKDGPVQTIVREARKHDTIINFVAKERLDQLSATGTPAGSSSPLKTTPPIWGSAPSSATTRWRGRTSVWWWAT